MSLALFGAFVSTVKLGSVNILQPLQFAGLLVGAMLPYWFSAMTMKSVGVAAKAMVVEVRRQFTEQPGILDGSELPDYRTCVGISTEASLREMLAPVELVMLVMLTPLLVGFLMGIEMLAGDLVGASGLGRAHGSLGLEYRRRVGQCQEVHCGGRFGARQAQAQQGAPSGRDWRHGGRPAQGHGRALAQHSHQADGHYFPCFRTGLSRCW